MRTNYDTQPEKIQIEEAADHAVVFLREKITKEDEGYSADEYYIITEKSKNLYKRVEANFDTWLERAKEEPEEKESTEDILMETALDHEERICMLELFS